MNQGIIASSIIKLDSSTTTWLNAVYAAGGEIGQNTLFYVNEIVRRLKAKNLWNDLIAYYPCSGGIADGSASYTKGMIAQTINLRNPGTYNLVVSTPTNGTGFYPLYLYCRSSTAYCNTTIVPSTVLSSNNMSWGTWYYSAGAFTNYVAGVSNSASQSMRLTAYGPNTPNRLYSEMYSQSAGGYANAAPTALNGPGLTFQGGLYSSRSGSGIKLYEFGTLRTTIGAPSGSLPTLPIYLNGYNNNGTSARAATNHAISSFWICGRAYTDAEMADFNAIEQLICLTRSNVGTPGALVNV